MVIIRIEAKVFDDGALEQSLEPWGAKSLPWQISEPLGMYFPILIEKYQNTDLTASMFGRILVLKSGWDSDTVINAELE